MIGSDPFTGTVGKMIDTGLNVGANVIQSDLMGRHADARQLEMLRKAPIAQMQGYRLAGINPFSAQSTPISSPNVTNPTLPIGQGNLTDYIATMSQVRLNDSQVKRNDQQNEETKANIKLLEESAGLTHAQAVNANAELTNIKDQASQIRAVTAFIRAQTKTEGFKQENLQESTNVMHEQGLNLRESRAEIIANGKIAEYNLNQVLPLTTRMLYKDLDLKDFEIQRVRNEVAKVANEVALGSYSLQEAAITLQSRLRTAFLRSQREEYLEEKRSAVTRVSYGDDFDQKIPSTGTLPIGSASARSCMMSERS